MKREPTVWEKIFANDTSDKALISKIYTQLTQLNIRKTNNSITKWAQDQNRHFSKEDTQTVNRHGKMPNVTNHQRMQIKTTVRYDLTPARMAIIRKLTNIKYW